MIEEAAKKSFTRTRRFLADRSSPGKARRSRAGLFLALLILPLLLGVMACLPVPVGNPEKSRIDPALAGAWAFSNDDGIDSFIVLDPYDKRTWLLSMIDLEAAAPDAADTNETPQGGGTTDTEPAAIRFSAASADRFVVEATGVYKCWLSRIGGETFMTWESKNLSETAPGEKPEYWWVFRVRKGGDDVFYLDTFDYKVDGLDKVKTTREAEKIIRRHIDDPGFFDLEDTTKLQRLPASDFEALQGLLRDFGITDNM